MVHVEIFTGGETGEQSIGARWQKGVVQFFDSYKFIEILETINPENSLRIRGIFFLFFNFFFKLTAAPFHV
jgi:NADH:ubiquinone oxidoreductase subunit 2 (subunit N)